MDSSQEQFRLLLNELERRLLVESIPRILKCLDFLNQEEIWWSPNSNSNSIGNLILHLEGNITQWLNTTFLNHPDKRNRPLEFEANQNISKEDLIHILKVLSNSIHSVLQVLKKEQLVEKYKVQGFKETGISVIVHVIEHCSYHVGQITFQTKALKNVDTGFYSDMDLG